MRWLRRHFGWTPLVLAMLALSSAAGCGFVALGAQAFEPKNKARFRMEDRPTLVLVDDLQRHLGSPANATLLAETISGNLVNEGALKNVIAPSKADAHLIALGDRAGAAGIDDIGRAVDAEQVVYVYVESASLFSEPGLLQPEASVRVKVIDVMNRKRLFPTEGAAESEPGAMLTPRGYAVVSKIGPRGVDSDSPSLRNAMYAQLTRRVGRDVARVFHEYHSRQPGEPFE